ncbi:MAG: class I SAM-dependent methyltransferase [Dehalococcoidales bacterium]|jgi:SAM-dependent methyltransferase
MADDISDISSYYDNHVEMESNRLQRHQQERDITWRYFDKYLPPRGNILEIGSATGAYTIPLAKKGYNITAVDLSPKNVEACQKRVAEAGLENKVKCVCADGRDLSPVKQRNFDVVLLMGPLYHLVEQKDREKAVLEAYRRLKLGGLIFSAFVSRYGIWGNLMTTLPLLIERQEDLRSVMKEGKDAVVPAGGFRGYFATTREIAPLHEKAGFKTLVLAGVEPANTVADGAYAGLEGERKQQWLDLLFAISTEPSLIGACDHLLYIGAKEGK